jgi:hypothetical protein
MPLTPEEIKKAAHDLGRQIARDLDEIGELRAEILARHFPELRPWIDNGWQLVNKLTHLNITNEDDDDDDDGEA